MRPCTLYSIFALITCTWSAPVAPLSQTTVKVAGGDTPKGGAPPKLSSNGIANFQLANFIENIEVQFFTQVLSSLANDDAFTKRGADGVSIQDVVTKVAAQEMVHKATIEGALSANNGITIPECTNVATVSSTAEFLARANLITSTSIGAIIGLSASLAISDPSLITTSTSILGVEARQDGFFRLSGNVIPNVAPFETQMSAVWAYNLILDFVDVKSCPTTLPIPILPDLTITTPLPGSGPPTTAPLTITFSVDKNVVSTGKLYIGWVNQVNAPVYTTAVITGGLGIAAVPSGLNGAAIVALTGQNTASTVDALSAATIAGPSVVTIS